MSTTTPRVEAGSDVGDAGARHPPRARRRSRTGTGAGRGPARHPACRSARRPIVVAFAVLAGALIAGVSIGPADLSMGVVARVLAAHIPFLHLHTGVTRVQSDIVWQVRMPRVVLGGLVGAMLAGGGAAYQGVFRNPLADPYLLGVAAGAGLGATIVIVAGPGMHQLVPVAAFIGAAAAVVITYGLGAHGEPGAHHRVDRAGRGCRRRVPHGGADLCPAAAHPGPPGGLHLDPRAADHRDMVRRRRGRPLCSPECSSPARAPSPPRRAARRGGRGHDTGCERRPGPVAGGGRRHHRDRCGGGVHRAHRLRRHHRAAHRPADRRARATGWCFPCR